MRTIGRRLLIPTVLLATVAGAILAYIAWGSAQQASVMERDTHAVRTATALAVELDDATQDEERCVLSAPYSSRRVYEACVGDRSARTADLVGEIQALSLPPRAAAVWEQFLDARAALLALGSEVTVAVRGGDQGQVTLALSKWRLMSARSNALLKNFSSYHLRSLDRTVAELQERRTRALSAAAAALVLTLLVAVVLSAAAARALVRPIVGIAGAAERIAETGRLDEVSGTEREDELGILARSFNRMTARLVGANAQLAEADRRKDEFLAMLSHELRNPLAPIRNALHLLKRAEGIPAQARQATDLIGRQVEHLTRLVDDLLDVTRIACGKIELRREVLDLGKLASRACEDHRPLMADRGVELTVEPAPGAVWVDGDATRLMQAIGNLLQNAAKFTPRGGRVSVAVWTVGEAAEVRVSDTGAGIDPALLPHVFERFVQADRSLERSGGGLGLGLSVVRGVAEQHGGSVTARSDGLGAGAEFALRLPLAAPPADARRPPPSEPPAPAAVPGRHRVLVVDDNEDAAVTLAELIELSGHTTAVAHDGPTALSLARADPPDIVLCDIGLPGMSGYEVARALRSEQGAELLLVAISGYAQPDDVRRALEAGFDHHLAKPPRMTDVEQLLQKATRRGARTAADPG